MILSGITRRNASVVLVQAVDWCLDVGDLGPRSPGRVGPTRPH